MFRFRVEIAGEVQLDRGIARFSDGVADYRPIWPVIMDDFYAEEKGQFQSEGAEGGEQWKPLSAEYAALKEMKYPGKPILQATGELYTSLTDPGSPSAVHVEGRKSLTLGSTVPYGLYHQTGTEKMSARKEVQFSEAFKRSVMHHLQTYLVQVASMSGFRTGLGPLQSSQIARAAHGMLGAGSSNPVQVGGRSFQP